jgi:hypothetical protein
MQMAQQAGQQQAVHMAHRARMAAQQVQEQQQGRMAGQRVLMGLRMAALLGHHMVGPLELLMEGQQVCVEGCIGVAE